MTKITVTKDGRTWAVRKDGVVVEGGFFDRDAAYRLADNLRDGERTLDFLRPTAAPAREDFWSDR